MLRSSRAILSGELTGPKRDVVLLNAACGLYVAGKAECIQGRHRSGRGAHRHR